MYNSAPPDNGPPGMPAPMPQYQPGPPTPVKPGQPRWAVLLVSILSITLVIELIVLAFIGNLPQALFHSPTPALTSTANPAKATQGPTSAFQTASCPFTPGAGLVQGQTLICGYVTVPENRSLNNGRKVRLAVAIFKHEAGVTDPDPVLRLDGGPGGPSLNGWASAVTAANFKDFVFDHDLIMFDQRGTGYSQPSLNCPEIIQLQYATISEHLTPQASDKLEVQAARTCHDRLVQSGIDLNSYTTIENAADVRDLIHALGYKQMTLYGVSYGTRLALTVMRLYPEAIHAVVLDSTYPTQERRTSLVASGTRAFATLFKGCVADANCNRLYPNLEAIFYSLVTQLNAHPISFQTTNIETGNSYTAAFAGDDFVFWLFSALYVTQLIPLLPQAIYNIRAHNYDLLSRIYGFVEFDDTFSFGLFYSVTCGEDWAFSTQQDITTATQGIAKQIQPAFTNELTQEYQICQIWHEQAVPQAQKQVVTSTVPTLVLSGEYDPITIPADGKFTAQQMQHSYYYLFPGMGHGEEYNAPCANTVISEFEDDPNQAPNSSCIGLMAEPAFT